MRQTRIAILGGCVSRAPFSNFPESSLKVIAQRFGTSLICLMSPPLSVDTSAFTELSKSRHLCVEGDFTRSSLNILDFDFDYLLIDFAEETCDLIRIGDSYALNSSYARASGVLKQFPGHKNIQRHNPATTALWKDACVKFCRTHLANIPQNRIIFHHVELAGAYRAEATVRQVENSYSATPISQAIKLIKRALPYESFLGKWVREKILVRFQGLQQYILNDTNALRRKQLNPVLQEYSRFFRELLPGAHVIQVPEKLRLSDANHNLGFYDLRYIKEYDEYFMREMKRIVETGSSV